MRTVIVGIFIGIICFVSVGMWPQDALPAQEETETPLAQEGAAQAPVPSISWVAKVADAITAETEVTLTADEVQALGRAYAALEQRQVADIAISETHVYVLSPAGTVVLSKALPALP